MFLCPHDQFVYNRASLTELRYRIILSASTKSNSFGSEVFRFDTSNNNFQFNESPSRLFLLLYYFSEFPKLQRPIGYEYLYYD